MQVYCPEQRDRRLRPGYTAAGPVSCLHRHYLADLSTRTYRQLPHETGQQTQDMVHRLFEMLTPERVKAKLHGYPMPCMIVKTILTLLFRRI